MMRMHDPKQLRELPTPKSMSTRWIPSLNSVANELRRTQAKAGRQRFLAQHPRAKRVPYFGENA